MSNESDAALVDCPEPMIRSDLPLPGRREGKVRDLYSLAAQGDGAQRLLIIATDRISAFDVILPTPIPGKGCLLTQISTAWFSFVRSLGVIGDHVVSTDARDVAGLNASQRLSIESRAMICRAAEVVPVEFIVRGYLAGSGWREYQQRRSVCGVPLDEGLRESEKLAEPIFTPTTKAASGHDEPMNYRQVCAQIGTETAERLRDVSLHIYTAAAEFTLSHGIILADTKFEFGYALDEQGRPTDELILIDEVLTPDSSRYWPADAYTPGVEQHAFDKQYVRSHLQEMVDAGAWDKTPPGPPLPPEVVQNTQARYAEVWNRLFASSTTA